jgi:WD40 repeat protein/DNA-binding SARP family transcriptional activator
LAVRFQLLGPLAVSGDDGPIAIGGPKQRLVLAHLLLRVNQTVPSDRLIDAVWGEEPPETARGTLQSYVSRLRNTLGSGRIQGKAPGYLFRAEPEELDGFRFESLLREARDDSLEPKAALDVLDEALALWRGPALADLAFEPSLLGEIARLEELRLAATEERIGVRLDLGQHAEVIPELEAATVAHPLRERLSAQLVLALYRSGRQAEALAAFDRARELLADELGIDPSHELQDLHERVLRQDESLRLPGEPLRGYRLLDKVGEGAFGSVYRAIQPQVEREVAIKSIHAALANQPDFVRRFEREAQLVARLEHPHIVPLYDYWREPDAAYLIMRFLRGGSLENVLQDGPLELGRATKIVDQIGAALAAAHHQGVVHRDVKPGNVLLDEEGNAYLSDFGIALETGAPEQTAGTMIRGSPAYLSPEQIRLEQTTPRSDIYALGVVLYEMLTGEHPFPGTSLNARLDQHLNQPIPSVRRARPELSPAVDAAIARATAKEPQARFGDVLELCAAFRGAIEGTAARVIAPGEIRNPYKGLRAFFEADSADFFGREVLTRRLIERLAEHGAARFLCLVGPSGSGKSSTVRAGLVPAIRRGAIRGSDRWYIADLLPGGHPMRELERALLGVSVDPPPSLLDDLERDELGLARAVDRLLPDPDAELLIVLDQLEELFTIVENDAERTHVLESFRVAAEDPTSRVRVIATLRADFYDQPLSVRGFGDLLAARNEAITPMSPEELERAIVGPAERVGLDVEPGLVAAMVADVIDRPGALPLLQYALTELADREDVGSLTLNAYRRIGGVSGALARRAERLHDALDDPGREACRQLFLRLVTLGEASDDTRRRVRRSELSSSDPDATDPVIDAFGRHRLLSFDRDPTSREPTVEIAHEALLGAWTRLRGWIDEAREDVRQERALGRGAAEWRASDRDPSFLLQGNRLLQMEAWAEGTDLAMASAHREFLDASIERRDAERAMEDRRRERERYLERRSRSRLRVLVAVLSAAALVASALTVIAVGERRVASEQSRVALARELAAASVANLDLDAERSILLALEAIETTRSRDGTVLREAEEALHRAVSASRIVRSLPGEGDILDWSPDGSLFVTEGEEETGLVDIRDARTGESVVRPFRGHDSDVNGVVFSADGSMLATTGDDGDVRVWDTSTGEELWGFDGPTGVVWVPSFSPDGSLLAAPFEDEDVVRIWDLATGRLVREIEHGDIGFATSFSPDGQRMAFATWDSGAIVVDVRSGEQVLHLPHGGPVNDVGWSPDGSRIATSGGDGTVRIWEAESGVPRGSLYGHRSSVVASDWSPDSSRLVTGSTDGTARIWEIHPDGGNELLSLPAQAKSTWVWPTFSADGTRVMTGAGPRGAVRLWDVSLSGDAEWANVPTSAVSGVAFTSDGTGVIASNGDGSATVWDASSGQGVRVIGRPGSDLGPLAEPDPRSPLFAMEVSTDGLVAASGMEGTVTVWEESTGNERFVLPVPAIRGWYPDLAWSGDGTVLAAARWPDGVTILVDQAGQEVAAIREEKGYFANALRLSRDGRLLATSRESVARPNTETARVTIWDWRKGKIILTISGWALDVDFDPSGDRVAIGSLFGPGGIWDVRSGRKLASLSGHTGSIQSIRFSPDGSVVATAGKDGTVRLWDPGSGTQLLLLDGHQAEVFALAFSPDGSKLASSSWDGTVRVWALDLNDLIQIARAELTRGFTEAECRQYLHVDACLPA